MGVYRNHLVKMSCKRNSSLTTEPILIKLDTVAVYKDIYKTPIDSKHGNGKKEK